MASINKPAAAAISNPATKQLMRKKTAAEASSVPQQNREKLITHLKIVPFNLI